MSAAPRSARIMVIDDSATLRELIYWCLGGPSSPFDITSLESADHALEVLQTETVDLILTDQYMPGTSGVRFIETVRRDPRHARTPVVMITSDDDQALERAALDAGADAVLLKPFTPESLMALVRSLLDSDAPVFDASTMLTIQTVVDAFPFLAMVLDEDHNALVSNDPFYATTSTGIGDCTINCAAAVHGLDAPPPTCPLVRSVDTGRAESGLVDDERLGTLAVRVFPLAARTTDGKRLFLHLAEPIQGA